MVPGRPHSVCPPASHPCPVDPRAWSSATALGSPAGPALGEGDSYPSHNFSTGQVMSSGSPQSRDNTGGMRARHLDSADSQPASHRQTWDRGRPWAFRDLLRRAPSSSGSRTHYSHFAGEETVTCSQVTPASKREPGQSNSQAAPTPAATSPLKAGAPKPPTWPPQCVSRSQE